MRVHVWMPCHSTPLYSVVHMRGEMVSLDCSPDAVLTHPGGDESFRFRADPLAFLRHRYDGGAQLPAARRFQLPTHAVVFDTTVPLIEPFLVEHGYSEVCPDPRVQ